METLLDPIDDNRTCHKAVRENILILETLKLAECRVAEQTDTHICAEVCIAMLKFSDVFLSTVISFEKKVGELLCIFLKDRG